MLWDCVKVRMKDANPTGKAFQDNPGHLCYHQTFGVRWLNHAVPSTPVHDAQKTTNQTNLQNHGQYSLCWPKVDQEWIKMNITTAHLCYDRDTRQPSRLPVPQKPRGDHNERWPQLASLIPQQALLLTSLLEWITSPEAQMYRGLLSGEEATALSGWNNSVGSG